MWPLLRQRRFGPFFWTQFLGAFNDNVFKNALVILIAFQGAGLMGGDTDTLVNLAAGLFILPFFLFSASAGQVADKYEKSHLIRLVKIAEILIMAGAAVALYFNSLWMLIGLLFLMGTQSTVFGPVKYSILPQHLREEELVGGNGLVEMGTFLAILLGTIAGGLLIAAEDGRLYVAGALVTLAVLGYLTSRGIPQAAPAAPTLRINPNPLTETWRIFRFTRQNRAVFLSILGISWFWFYGALVLAQLPNFTRQTLGGNEQVVTLLLTVFSLGIGIGSLLCERLSGDKVEIGLVPFGSIGMTIFGFDLFFARPTLTGEALVGAVGFLQFEGSLRVLVDLVLLGIFGGFYIVPLYAMVQQRTERSHLSRVIAGNNILNALFMVASAGMAIGLLSAGLTIPQLFLVAAILNALVAIYIYTLVPEFLMRFLVWLLIHTIYRVRAKGLSHIPEDGPVLLTSNHVSFVDALIIGGSCRRPVRFVMDHGIFKIPVLNFIFRTANAIPIASARVDKALLEKAYDTIDEALAQGDVVCIFPEGKITKDGEMNPFKPGVEKIVARRPVPVIPLALQGLYGSLFSRKYNGFKRMWPHKLWAAIGLNVGAPLQPEHVTAASLQSITAELRGPQR